MKYLGKFEIGKKTKKKHFQGALWIDDQLSDNDRNKIRAFWKKDIELKHRNSVSITVVRKPESICKYVTKEEGKCYTNLTKEELSKVGAWDDYEQNIENHMIQWVKEHSDKEVEYEVMTPVINEWYSGTVNDFVREYFRCYNHFYKKYPTNRQKWKIWRMMKKLQVVTLDEYIKECRII